MAQQERTHLDVHVPDELLRTAVTTSDPEPTVDVAVPLPGVGAGPPPSLRTVVAGPGVAALALMTAGNMLARGLETGLAVLGPDIQETFALSDTGLGALVFAMGAAYFVLAVPVALLADRRQRTSVAAVALAVWAGAVLAVGLAPSVWVVGILVVVAGVGRAAPDSVHLSYLCDTYPVEGRARVIAVHRAAIPLGGVIVAGAMAAVADALSWRWGMAVGLLGVPVALAMRRLAEPRRGGQERAALGRGASGPSDELPPKILVGTALQRLRGIRSLASMYLTFGVLGFAALGIPVIGNLYFERRWDLSSGGRTGVAIVLAAATSIGLVIAGVFGDRLFRRDPARPLMVGAAALAAFGVAYASAVHLPALWLVVTGMVIAEASLALVATVVLLTVAAIAPPSMRSLMFALVGIYSLVGGLAGSIVLGGVSDARSPDFALTLLGPVALAGAGVLYRGARDVAGDISRSVEDILEEDDASHRRVAGITSRAIEVHNLDFSYGTQQVLFDVNLEIDEGEICALLGTNGAGKSTLLRVIAGLEHPTRGSVRLFGTAATYLEAEQVVDLGVAMLPGGKMTFPSLTVDENLRAGSFTVAPDRRAVAIEEVYETFPVLGERRQQAAGTLSGGEQQMLALGRALVHKPRLLLIDELTLGLAPKVVERLLEIVRAINASGTTVVLVEQSVNLALTLAARAVFLERGQVRFDGRTADLVRRDDLLRPVFLGNER